MSWKIILGIIVAIIVVLGIVYFATNSSEDDTVGKFSFANLFKTKTIEPPKFTKSLYQTDCPNVTGTVLAIPQEVKITNQLIPDDLTKYYWGLIYFKSGSFLFSIQAKGNYGANDTFNLNMCESKTAYWANVIGDTNENIPTTVRLLGISESNGPKIALVELK